LVEDTAGDCFLAIGRPSDENRRTDTSMKKTPISVYPMSNDPYMQDLFPRPDEAGKARPSKKKKKKDKNRK
jgi:hypothetical protein